VVSQEWSHTERHHKANINRQHPTAPKTCKNQKRKKSCGESKQDPNKMVRVTEESIDYDRQLDFRPLGFNANNNTCSSKCKKDEYGKFTQRSKLKNLLRNTFLQSNFCALSHFRNVTENIADQNVEILQMF
jgi:hypothetical protein